MTRTGTKRRDALTKVCLEKLSVEFILDVGLMCDDLQELSELSLDLQERNIDLNEVHNRIVCLVNVYESR
jgi:hypothetical protein